jgi:hypothetical protein
MIINKFFNHWYTSHSRIRAREESWARDSTRYRLFTENTHLYILQKSLILHKAMKFTIIVK